MAYNAAFEHFDVKPKGEKLAEWSVKFYDALQNKVGGGKPKMRWYFGEPIRDLQYHLKPTMLYIILIHACMAPNFHDAVGEEELLHLSISTILH